MEVFTKDIMAILNFELAIYDFQGNSVTSVGRRLIISLDSWPDTDLLAPCSMRRSLKVGYTLPGDEEGLIDW